MGALPWSRVHDGLGIGWFDVMNENYICMRGNFPDNNSQSLDLMQSPEFLMKSLLILLIRDCEIVRSIAHHKYGNYEIITRFRG